MVQLTPFGQMQLPPGQWDSVYASRGLLGRQPEVITQHRSPGIALRIPKRPPASKPAATKPGISNATSQLAKNDVAKSVSGPKGHSTPSDLKGGTDESVTKAAGNQAALAEGTSATTSAAEDITETNGSGWMLVPHSADAGAEQLGSGDTAQAVALRDAPGRTARPTKVQMMFVVPPTQPDYLHGGSPRLTLTDADSKDALSKLQQLRHEANALLQRMAASRDGNTATTTSITYPSNTPATQGESAGLNAVRGRSAAGIFPPEQLAAVSALAPLLTFPYPSPKKQQPKPSQPLLLLQSLAAAGQPSSAQFCSSSIAATSSNASSSIPCSSRPGLSPPREASPLAKLRAQHQQETGTGFQSQYEEPSQLQARSPGAGHARSKTCNVGAAPGVGAGALVLMASGHSTGGGQGGEGSRAAQVQHTLAHLKRLQAQGAAMVARLQQQQQQAVGGS